MKRYGRLLRLVVIVYMLLGAAFGAVAQPLLKSAVQVDAGNTKQTGQTFGYRLTYDCSSTSGPCLNAQVVDLLPAEVQYVSTVPASPTGDVAAINVTPNFGGSGRTRVQFVMITPLTAGNSGDLIVNVRFPNGSTPNGTVATNTADGINLGATPGTFTTPPVSVTAVATLQSTLTKTLQTSPANLDLPETYRLRIAVPNNPGAVDLTAVGPVVDTLPPGTVFNGATPAADCEPGCTGTTPATVTWTSPCSVPIAPGGTCDISVNVTFPSATFTSGASVTNTFTATGTPLGLPPQNLGQGSVTHTVTTFVPNPSAGLAKVVDGNSPNPPTLNQTFSYNLAPSNAGNVPLDTMVVIDTLPVQFQLSSVTTGTYNNAANFAAGVGVQVSYEKNTAPGVFTLWGSSPNVTTNTTLTAPPPGLGAGEYVTRVRWEFGQAAVGMGAATRPLITGKIVNPSNTGAPVAFGDAISNCASLTSVYTAGPTNANRGPTCANFTLSGPFVQLNPAKDNLSGAGPFNPGQTVSWRLRVRSAPQSSDPAPLQGLVGADLLPVDLSFTSWTFDDQGTGLPAPQNFTQTPNYAGTGRTLLRWTWNAGSGSLGVNQQVWININTTVRDGVIDGALSNTFDLSSNNPGLGQRCSGGSTTDTLDLDGDGSNADTLCTATGTANVAPIAQLVSSKTIQGTCDGSPTASSQGTLLGGGTTYHLHVQNVGSVPMQNFVLIDILPFVGDTGVRDTSPRGSQWTPLLSGPITPPSGTSIYYTTASNPCRGEVGGPTTGCTAPNWSTIPPSPITATRAFKVEFGSRVANPFDSLDFDYQMTTPANVPAGATAYNSFAYQADRADGLGSLSAEPQKVGIALGSCTAASLGDFVWVDVNKNGAQDDGATGLNNVPVRLYSPGIDGIPNTSDDVLLSSTVTQNSPTNAPGWYTFPGLTPGSYFVKIDVPPTFTLTTPHATTTATDSDGDPVTASSGVVTLGAGENNPTIDFGLIATHLAALGDYVWFDRNSDGIQNEAVTDGANGVTVKLFVDNGNGVPDAGDALVETTLTANDANGRPGYYLFDGLIPGLPYYVQFVKPAVATGFTSLHTGGDGTVDSDANTSTGNSQIVTLAPDEVNRTIDAGLIAPTGNLALGDQVWLDADNDGVFEPQNGEVGIDGVRLDLYRDVNNDGLPGVDEYLGTTTSQTTSGFAGRYRFSNLAPGNYIVVVNPSNFSGSGALAGMTTSTGNDPAPDPDDDVNGDDNGTAIGALTGSHAVTLSTGGEPTSEDGDANTNLTVDFGFIPSASATAIYYDYGDAPDVGAGTARGDYNTTQLDNGPYHLLGVPNAPYLGNCVDADSGLVQGVGANGDDAVGSPFTVGICATPGDDEDGVTFTGPFVPGATATFNVTANGPSDCHLDAWVDWNQDGVFGDSAGEQIATNLVIPHGAAPTVLSPAVPAGAIPGTTYARFRCSSAGNLLPTGPAADGEVEDYAVGVVGYDYGDAPASYGTQGAGAARHLVTPGTSLYLGQCVDTEADGQPSVNADGDDSGVGTSRVGACLDDEDGIVFTSPITACTTATIGVTAGAAGKLDAWIDFGQSGTFAGAGKQIFASQALVAGLNTLTFPVPCNATQGKTYARFRLSSAGALGPTGDAADGEVEDYAVNVSTVDFGDAPDTYHTTLANNGPYHAVIAGFSLGATEDSEPDGQPSVAANGDGADEDGVTVTGPLLACSAKAITVNLTNTAGIAAPKLDAWIDFDHDGTFDDPRDRVATSQALASGANTVTINVPCDAKLGPSYARFRLSSTGTPAPTGAAIDGEVEDYTVAIAALDFGDAPDSYGTTLPNGARHAIGVTPNLYLGACVDAEADGQPSAGANGDDNGTGSGGTIGTCAQAGRDEDGVTFTSPIQACSTSATVTVVAGAAGKLDAWIDFNRNGVFDAADQIFTNQSVVAGSNTLTYGVPCGALPGATYSRFRLSSAGGLGPTGAAADGEVEDYAVTQIANLPQLGLAKRLVSSTQDTTNHSKFHLSFAFVAVNSGNADLSAVQVIDSLATTFAGATSFQVVSVSTSGTFAPNVGYDGNGNDNLLANSSTLATGAQATITLNVDIVVDALRTFANTAAATATGPGNTPVTDTSQDGSDPDPDHNGDPGDNSVPTPVVLPPLRAQIGLAKRVVDFNYAPDTQNLHVVFGFVVANPGNVDLSNIQVLDDLATAFTGATSFHVAGVSATGTLVANAAFDGAADKSLLAAGSTLSAGATATITMIVDVKVGTVGIFANIATTTASTPSSTVVGDTSQNGADPDPDSDGDPTNNNVPTPIIVPFGLRPTPALDLGAMALLLLLLMSVVALQRRRTAK